MAKKKQPETDNTHEPLAKLLGILASPWTLLLLHRLHVEGPKRFGELKRRLGTISTKTLTERLRMLESRGLAVPALRADRAAAGHLLHHRARVLELDGVMRELDRIAERWYGKKGDVQS